MLTIEQARDKLRLDGSDNDSIIETLLTGMPEYIAKTTGIPIERQDNTSDPVHDLVNTLEGFLIQLWYDPENRDVEKIQRVISSLTITLYFMA